MKDIWVTIRSLRNTYNLFMDNVFPWLQMFVLWSEAPPSDALLRKLYYTLELDLTAPDVPVGYVCVYMDRRFVISAQFRDDPDVLDNVAGAIVSAFHFRNYSESRWVGLAPSGRSLVVSDCFGLSSFVDMMRVQTGASDFYIKSFARWDDAARKCTAIAALGSSVVGLLLHLVLENDCLVKQVNVLEDACASEFAFVNGISEFVFAFIAKEVVHSNAVEIRSEVLQAVYVQEVYIREKALAIIYKLPFYLCRGDRLAKPRKKCAGGRPEYVVAVQIYDLRTIGYPEEQCLEIIEDISDIPFSTGGVKQDHAQASRVPKHHPEIQSDMLQARSFFRTSIDSRHLLLMRLI